MRTQTLITDSVLVHLKGNGEHEWVLLTFNEYDRVVGLALHLGGVHGQQPNAARPATRAARLSAYSKHNIK